MFRSGPMANAARAAAADHGAERPVAKAQQDGDRGGAAVALARLREGVDLDDLADEVAREVDEMGALLVQLAAGERRISPPGNPVGRADPMRGEAEYGFAFQEALRAATEGRYRFMYPTEVTTPVSRK